MKRKISNDEILNELRNELIRIDSTTRDIYDSERSIGHYCAATICDRLNMNWTEIIILIGLQPNNKMSVPEEKQLEALKKEFERIGSYLKSMYAQKRNKEKFPHPDLLCESLGMSWYEITRICGREKFIEVTSDTATDEELIQEYKSLSEGMGGPITAQELKKQTSYSFEIYRQHFGTITKLRVLCGYESPDTGGRRILKEITKEECTHELLRLYRQHGKRLTYNELKELSGISISTIFRRFHTTKITRVWDEVLKEKRVNSKG